MKNQITISDIAKRAEVSKTTISRFLNGNYTHMSEKTREKISEIVKDLDYRPSKQAQGLKNKKSWLIGLLVADIENLYTAYIIKYIQDELFNSGYQLVIMNSDNSEEKEKLSIQELIDQNVEGIILQPVSSELESFQLIEKLGVKTILIDRKLKGSTWPSVESDNENATGGLVEYLWKKGYQRVVFVTQEIGQLSVRQERFNGAKIAADKRNLDFYCLELGEGGRHDLSEYVKKLDFSLRTVFIGSNGNALRDIILILNQEGLKFPEICGVSGYDDWFWAELITPQVSNIRQNPEQLGKKAVQNLLELIDGKEVWSKTVIKSIFIERQSL
ncbi:MAG: LacI family transcriptional regulator [Streptococcaceae bacterium]|jgi:LacI family kdg operon repressor|nr:LacI family transcriptional regulator [Streptococcaceae bacterium]